MLFSCWQLIYIFSFLFFFNTNNTEYPTNDCDGWIYPFLRFSLTNFYKAKFSVSVNLQIRKNFGIVLGLSLILQSHSVYFASLLLFGPYSLVNLWYLLSTQSSLSSASLKVVSIWYHTILVFDLCCWCYISLILTHPVT